MKLDSMQVAIRPMNSLQAIDLGVMVARHWFLPLWKLWCKTALPLFIVYLLVIVLDDYYNDDFFYSSVFALVFWWLKPIYEKPLVDWLGQALFSTDISTIQLKKLPLNLRIKQNIKLLFRYRLSASRQIILPIMVLEISNVNRVSEMKKCYKENERRCISNTSSEFDTVAQSQFVHSARINQRLRLLRRGQGNHIFWHTMILMNFEVLLSITLIFFLYSLVPQNLLSSTTLLNFFQHSPLIIMLTTAVLFFLIISVVAPFFICSGFILYLSKRCLLEGWDIEVTFKQLSRRFIDSHKGIAR